MEPERTETSVPSVVQVPDDASIRSSEVALIVAGGPWSTAVEEGAAAVGATVDRYEAGEVGLAGLAAWVRSHGRSVLYLPSRLGRWLPGPPFADASPSLRAVVLVGNEPDDASVDGVRAVFGPDAEIVHWPIHAAPPGQASGAWRGPSDELERDLLELVERVTGAEGLGVDDSFFDVGGTAEAAAWLVDDIGWRCGVGLRPVELFDHPTVGELAAVVGRDRGRSVQRPVTATLAGDPTSAEVVFLFHDLSGSAFSLAPLATQLADGLDHRVVGVESPLLNGAPNPFRSIELMAMRYLVDLRRIQPAGPYRLAGWGFGGVVAFEVARQLRGESAQISLVAVADAGPAIMHPSHRNLVARLPRLQRPGTPGRVVRLSERPAYALSEHRRLLASHRWRQGEALRLPVALAWSADVGARDATMGWAGLVDPDLLEIDRLPTAHHDPVAADGIGAWAQVLRRRLASS